jgi:hypothetical protein
MQSLTDHIAQVVIMHACWPPALKGDAECENDMVPEQSDKSSLVSQEHVNAS